MISYCENLQRRGQSDKQGADDNVHDALPNLQPSIPQVKNSKTLNLFLDNFNFTHVFNIMKNYLSSILGWMKRKQWSQNHGSGTSETTRWCTTVDTNLPPLRSPSHLFKLELNYFNERQESVDRTKWTLYNLEKSQKSDLKTLKISSPSKTLGVDWRNWVGATSSSRAQDAIAGAAWCRGWNGSGLRIKVNWNERINIPIQSYQRQRCSSNVKKTLSRELVKRARSRDKGLVMIPVCFSFRF